MWLFTDFGSRKVVCGEFHCPHVQSCMRCKYWVSLWCRWCIMASQYVSAVSILPPVKSVCSALVGQLSWFWCVMFAAISRLHFVYRFSPLPGANSSLPAQQRHRACLMNSASSFRNKFYVMCCVGSLRIVCMCVFNELFVFACWLILHESAPVCFCLRCHGATCLFFPASFSRPLLRRRDKTHWCLSAHWQITEADRYKDSGRQLLYAGGQRRTCLGCLSWPQHQSILNAIWLLYTCRSSWANYGFKITQRVNVGNRRKRLWTRKESKWFPIL